MKEVKITPKYSIGDLVETNSCRFGIIIKILANCEWVDEGYPNYWINYVIKVDAFNTCRTLETDIASLVEQNRMGKRGKA